MKILVLDKDGTIIRPKSGGQWVQYPQDQELIEGVAEAIARYRDDGWEIAIASNQGGVEAGHKTLGDAILEMEYAMKLTGIRYGIFAPSYEDRHGKAIFLDSVAMPSRHREVVSENGVWRFRKPAPGMILFLESELNLNKFVGCVMMVGDRVEDDLAAIAAGAEFMDAEQWRSGG